MVAAHFRRRIVLGELAEGDVLPPEPVLLAELSVSRPTLRQAFRILETEHLISVQRGSRGGTTVLRPSIELASRYLGDLLRFRQVTFGDVLAARLTIEPATMAELARHHAADAVAELAALAESSADPESADQFHMRLIELAGSSTLFQYSKLLHYLVRNHLRRHESRRGAPAAPPHGGDAHRRLVELVAAGAAHAAAAHWHDHLTEVHAGLARQFDLDATLEP